jgi:transaldolase
LLGQNHLVVTDFTTIPTLIAETILNTLKIKGKKKSSAKTETTETVVEDETLQPML